LKLEEKFAPKRWFLHSTLSYLRISKYCNRKNCYFHLLEDGDSIIHPGGSNRHVTTYMCLPHPAAIGPRVHRVGILP